METVKCLPLFYSLWQIRIQSTVLGKLANNFLFSCKEILKVSRLVVFVLDETECPSQITKGIN